MPEQSRDANEILFSWNEWQLTHDLIIQGRKSPDTFLGQHMAEADYGDEVQSLGLVDGNGAELVYPIRLVSRTTILS